MRKLDAISNVIVNTIVGWLVILIVLIPLSYLGFLLLYAPEYLILLILFLITSYFVGKRVLK
jgi:hypothetical protein